MHAVTVRSLAALAVHALAVAWAPLVPTRDPRASNGFRPIVKMEIGPSVCVTGDVVQFDKSTLCSRGALPPVPSMKHKDDGTRRLVGTEARP